MREKRESLRPPGSILIGGGARSGKSGYAQQRAEALPGPRIYLATAQAFDAEMEARIARHQAERGAAWAETIEEPFAVAAALKKAGDRCAVILVDCITLWLSNLLGRGAADAEILAAVQELGEVAARVPATVIIVTNEVGLGLVPEYPLGRRFRDLAGFANQALAAACDEVCFLLWGLPQRLKG